MIKPDARWFRFANFLAVHNDPVLVGDIQRRRGDDLAVHADAACLDHALGFAAAGDARAREDFGDPVAGGWGVIAHIPAISAGQGACNALA